MLIFMSYFNGTSQCKHIGLVIGVPSSVNCVVSNGTEHARIKIAFFRMIVGDDMNH